MYAGHEVPEFVSVIGTPAFMNFVESIKTEGVEFERKAMGDQRRRPDSLVIEADADKDVEVLDIAIPRLGRRFARDFRALDELDTNKLTSPGLRLRSCSPEETREIVFKTMLDAEAHHTVRFDGSGPPDYRAVGFRIDYVRTDGDSADYVPDLLVCTDDGTIYVVETKGRQERDLERKMARLAQWCADASEASRAAGGPEYRFVFVDQEGFRQNPPRDFAGLVSGFREFQP